MIATRRLIIREFSLVDADKLLYAMRCPQVHDMYANGFTDIERVRAYISLIIGEYAAGKYRTLAIAEKGGALIGAVTIDVDQPATRAEISYWIDIDKRRRGYATEAIAAVTQNCLEKFERAQAVTSNPISARALVKCGYVNEGVVKAGYLGRNYEMQLYVKKAKGRRDMDIRGYIEAGRAALGIELGSTRIKAVLIGEDHSPIASGDFEWENKLEGGYWTYDLDEAWRGMRAAFANLKADALDKHGAKLTKLGALGISAMMHGYLPFDEDMRQLAAFRTWRNTNTARAAEELTEKLRFNIPQRWSAAHLYQAILDNEPHIKAIARIETLATYIHFKLTGEHIAGVGEASGMFPIDSATSDYDAGMVAIFNDLLKQRGVKYAMRDIFPKVRAAGECAGCLTAAGARLIDPSGELEPGAVMCPPEGDAGTGMAATNSVSPRTGNVSAGTSVFAMAVLEKPLAEVHPEIDMVTTPSGAPVAMVHCNTCTSDLNVWVGMLSEMAELAGAKPDKNELFTKLFNKALEGDADCGGIVSFNCFTGEPVIGLEDGCPLLARKPGAGMSLANFMRAQLYATMATLKMGMDILVKRENVRIDKLLGHGGLFRTKGVGQRLLAGALNVPIDVMETAGEGGPWGMALLAAYRANKAEGESLEDYLNNRVFAAAKSETAEPNTIDNAGFEEYMQRYIACLPAEAAAASALK